MKDPCIECLVSACCSKRCRDYAEYVYITEEYAQAGEAVTHQIDKMKYEEAVDLILMLENIALHIRLL